MFSRPRLISDGAVAGCYGYRNTVANPPKQAWLQGTVPPFISIFSDSVKNMKPELCTDVQRTHVCLDWYRHHGTGAAVLSLSVLSAGVLSLSVPSAGVLSFSVLSAGVLSPRVVTLHSQESPVGVSSAWKQHKHASPLLPLQTISI